MNDPQPAVELIDVRVIYRTDTLALDQLSAVVGPKTTVLAVLGPDGAGKTTLIRTLAATNCLLKTSELKLSTNSCWQSQDLCGQNIGGDVLG